MNFHKLDKVDKSFDKFSPFPILSTFTGAGRALYGTAELIYGLAQAIIAGLARPFASDTTEKAWWEKKFDSGFTHLFFGAANVFKATFEAVPLVNLIVFWYNVEGSPLERTAWEESEPSQASTSTVLNG